MAFRWRADDGQTLNAGLVVALWFFRRSGSVLLRNPIFLWFSRAGGSGPPAPPRSGSAIVVFLVRALICFNTLSLFILMDFPRHVDIISRGLPLLLFKGKQFNFLCISVLKMYYIIWNSADIGQMSYFILQKYLFAGITIL